MRLADGRCAVTGGYRYRGPVLDAQGIQFFADHCAGKFWISTICGAAWNQPVSGPVCQSPGFGVTSLAEDGAGHLYAVQGSQIWRLPGAVLHFGRSFANGFEQMSI